LIRPLLDLVRDLIAFDTTSRDSNLALIDYAQTLAGKSRRRACRRTFDAKRTRRPICSPTFGPDGDGGLLCSSGPYRCGAGGRPGTGPPIPSSPRCATGLLFGRGASDMKGFIGVRSGGWASDIGKARLKRPHPFRPVL